MSDTTPSDVPATAGQLPVTQGNQAPPPHPGVAVHYQVAGWDRGTAVGKIRSTGVCMLLAIVTLGIYPLVWYYKTHEEMKRHNGDGLGGGLALVLAILIGIVMPYITASEVGGLYRRAGQRPPVSGTTGLWYFPGIFILIGPFIWFIKTNGALNAYWRSRGAV